MHFAMSRSPLVIVRSTRLYNLLDETPACLMMWPSFLNVLLLCPGEKGVGIRSLRYKILYGALGIHGLNHLTLLLSSSPSNAHRILVGE